MKKLFLTLILPLAFSLAFAYDSNDPTEPEVTKSEGSEVAAGSVIFRCDGFSDFIDSEWIKIDFSSNGKAIVNMWYWNSILDDIDDRQQLAVLNFQYHDGEISGWTGELMFPYRDYVYQFGIIEDNFNLIRGEDFFQVFTYESWID